MWPLLLGVAPLTVAAWFDGRERKIPNICPITMLICAGANVFAGGISWRRALLGVLIIGGVMLFLATRPQIYDSIGGGDVKLCAALGAMVGLMLGLVIIAAALTVMLISAAIMRKKTMPLAPALFGAYMSILVLEMIVNV